MSFLTPWAAVVAAAVAVPLLLLLYFLKLRRHTLRIASTLLWRSSAEDLQANVPFQRLRLSLLLLIQLLLLGLLLAALARPVIEATGGAPARVILLIDRSASMSATDAAPPGDPPRTRLEAALDEARRTVRRLGRRSEPAQLMVVAFGATPTVVSGFESGRQVLLDSLRSIEPTDEPADLDAALRLAAAFARGEEADDVSPPVIQLYSDGGVAPGELSLDAGTLVYRRLGPANGAAVRNVGITTFSARRDFEVPSRVLLFARLVNAGPDPAAVSATVRADGDAVAVRSVTVPPAGPVPGEAGVSLTLDLPRAAVLSMTIAAPDSLAADNTAALVLEAPLAPRIGLVHAGEAPDPFLAGLVEALEPQRLVILAAPEAGPVELPWEAGDLDLLVYDRVNGPLPPGLPTLTFGGAPEGLARRDPDRPGAARVLSWQRAHPLLRHVGLDTVRYVGTGGFELPAGWEALAIGPEGPVVAAGSTDSTGHVAVAFALGESNWPMDVSVTVFLQNVLESLVRTASGVGLAFRPGEPIAVRPRPDARELRIEGPAPAAVPVVPGAETTVAMPRVGLYAVGGAAPPMERVAINLVTEFESDIRPRESVTVNAQQALAGAAGDTAPLELWPILAGIAVGLLLLEWIVYGLRASGRRWS